MCVCVCVCVTKNFLHFRSDIIQKQRIKNFSSHCGKSNVPVVLCDSEVPFLGEGKEATLRQFLHCILFIFH